MLFLLFPKSSLFSCPPHNNLFSLLQPLFELCLSLKLPIRITTFLSLLPSHRTLPKAAFLLDSLPPVLESLTPLGSPLSLPLFPLNPIFHSWTTANFPQSSEQRSLYCWSTLNYPQLKPNANEKIALLWNDFKRTRVSRMDWRKSWTVASGGREELFCCVSPQDVSVEGGKQRLHRQHPEL